MNTATQAVNNPVRRSAPEINTGDMQIDQPPRIAMPDDGLPDRENIVVAAAGSKALESSKYMRSLQFNEDPVTIIIAPDQGKNPAPCVDVWVNGKGAEQLIGGQWVTKGWLPVNRPVTTRRKYVEVLIRSKPMAVNTYSPKLAEEDVRSGKQENVIDRNVRPSNAISVVGDENPAGREWLQKLMWEAQ